MKCITVFFWVMWIFGTSTALASIPTEASISTKVSIPTEASIPEETVPEDNYQLLQTKFEDFETGEELYWMIVERLKLMHEASDENTAYSDPYIGIIIEVDSLPEEIWQEFAVALEQYGFLKDEHIWYFPDKNPENVIFGIMFTLLK